MSATAIAPPVLNLKRSPTASKSEGLTEFLHGVEVELPPMSGYAGRVAFLLGRDLSIFAEQHDLGAVDVEAMFRIPTPDDPTRERRPDVTFTSYGRWPREQQLPLRDRAANVIPDLVVEVTSPHDNHLEFNEKVLQYFTAGVRRVWEIDPVLRRAVDHASPDEVHIIRDGGSLDGGEIVPGFRIALSKLLGPRE